MKNAKKPKNLARICIIKLGRIFVTVSKEVNRYLIKSSNRPELIENNHGPEGEGKDIYLK